MHRFWYWSDAGAQLLEIAVTSVTFDAARHNTLMVDMINASEMASDDICSIFVQLGEPGCTSFKDMAQYRTVCEMSSQNQESCPFYSFVLPN
jgi:hypothetical protein